MMRDRKTGRRGAGRLTALIAALLAAVLAAVPAAAATVTASDVMIRNSGEEKDNNIIGVLNEGDKVTVRSKSTDSSGTEWYYIELPNGNTGYVKAQWIDTDGEDVETAQAPAAAQQEEEPAKEEKESAQTVETDAGKEASGEEQPAEDADQEGIDDWTEEDAQMLNGTPVSDGAGEAGAETDGAGDEAAKEAQEGGGSVADAQQLPAEEQENTYDPYTDPDAQYSIHFITEKDGTGNWYVYNYDTDKRIRLSDLEKMSDSQQAAQKSASSAGIWRTIACILMVLLAALLIFLYLALRNTGRPAPRDRRARRRRASAYDEDEEEDDFVYAGSREEPEESLEEASDPGTQEQDQSRTEEIPAEDIPQDAGPDFDAAEAEAAGETPESVEEQEEDAPARAKEPGGPAGTGRKRNNEPYYDDEDDVEDDEDGEEDEDEFFDEEDEEDYDDDESYEEDGDDRIPRRGGFFGFLKNIFSSDGLEDDYDEDEDDYDEDDYDEEDGLPGEEDVEEEDETPYEEQIEEVPGTRGSRRASSRSGRQSRESAGTGRSSRRRPAKITVDEAADYPEDADLLPPDEPEAPVPGQRSVSGQNSLYAAGRNTAGGRSSYGTSDYGTEPDEEEDPDDFFADEDDDMEYSFLSSRAKRGNRRP